MLKKLSILIFTICICVSLLYGADDTPETLGKLALAEREILEDINLFHHERILDLEKIMDEAKFLKDYVNTARYTKRYVAFFWGGGNTDEILKHFRSTLRLKNSMIIKDLQKDLDMYDGDQERLQNMLRTYATPNSPDPDNVCMFAISPNGKSIYSFAGSTLDNIQISCYVLAAQKRLKGEKDAVIFQNIARSIDDKSSEGMVRDAYINKCKLPDPMPSIITNTRKKKEYCIAVVTANDKRDKKSIAAVKKEWGDRFPHFIIEVLTKESKVWPVLFRKDIYRGDRNNTGRTREYIIITGPDGIIHYGLWSRGNSRIIEKFFVNALYCIKRGDYAKAVKLLRCSLDIIKSGSNSYRRRTADIKTVIKRCVKLSEDKIHEQL